MRLVVSFTLDVEPEEEWAAIEAACALLPPGCEDIVIVTEAERDRLRALAAEDSAWFDGGD